MGYNTSRFLTLLGCLEEALGMENGKIPDSAIKANYQVNTFQYQIRLVYSLTKYQAGYVKIPLVIFTVPKFSLNFL